MDIDRTWIRFFPVLDLITLERWNVEAIKFLLIIQPEVANEIVEAISKNNPQLPTEKHKNYLEEIFKITDAKVPENHRNLINEFDVNKFNKQAWWVIDIKYLKPVLIRASLKPGLLITTSSAVHVLKGYPDGTEIIVGIW